MNNRYLIAGALALGAWWLYTKQQGLTILGQPENLMLPTGARLNRQSLVTPNTSTSALATNVFTGIADSLRAFVTHLQAAPGNASRLPAPSSTGIAPGDVRAWGLAVPPDEPAPFNASRPYSVDPVDSVDSLALWNGPFISTVPSMPWTLNPAILGFDPNYIPPPPGTR